MVLEDGSRAHKQEIDEIGMSAIGSKILGRTEISISGFDENWNRFDLSGGSESKKSLSI